MRLCAFVCVCVCVCMCVFVSTEGSLLSHDWVTIVGTSRSAQAGLGQGGARETHTERHIPNHPAARRSWLCHEPR